MKRWPLVLALVVTALGAALPAAAFTRLEGEYDFMVDVRKQDRRYLWDFDSNSDDTFNDVQFRLFSQPVQGVEAFTRFEADWNTGNNSNRRPLFQYREAHLRFRKEFGDKGIDSYLFSRQDRFWVDNHLIQVVQGGPANDGGNAQGARVDLWGGGPTNLTLIASDFSSQSNPTTGATGPSGSTDTGYQPPTATPTDDAYVGRLRREFFGGALRTGITWNRKDSKSRPGNDQRFITQVLGFDTRYSWHGTDFSLEYAEGYQHDLGATAADSAATEASSSAWPYRSVSNHGVVRGEIRSIRLGNYRTGYLNLAPSFWVLGPQYRNQLGDGNNDESGYFINTWYLVPGRAVTLTNNYTSYVKRVNQSQHITDFYSEAYVEFVNGFTGKLFYHKHTTRDWFSDGQTTIEQISHNDDVFAEMQVEDKLAWLRLQFRIRDLDTVFQKELASFETSVNVSSTVKIYNRFTFGNDPAQVRKGLFSELQYRPRPNLEMFLSYGPFWIGAGSNPVFEGNLQGSADNKDLVRLIVKGTF